MENNEFDIFVLQTKQLDQDEVDYINRLTEHTQEPDLLASAKALKKGDITKVLLPPKFAANEPREYFTGYINTLAEAYREGHLEPDNRADMEGSGFFPIEDMTSQSIKEAVHKAEENMIGSKGNGISNFAVLDMSVEGYVFIHSFDLNKREKRSIQYRV